MSASVHEPVASLRPSTTYLATVTAFLLLANVLIIVFTHQRIPFNVPFAAAALCLNVYLSVYFLLGNREVQSWLDRQLLQSHRLVSQFLGLLAVSYLIYALGTQSFRALPFLKLLGYMLFPTLLLLKVKRASNTFQWQDLIVILLLWLPLDFRWTRDAWAWPRHSLAYSMNSLLATCLAVFLFVAVRRLGGVGYQYHFQLRDCWIGLRNFMCFAPIAIPIGISTGFINLSSRFATPWQFLLWAIGIFIFVAIPEELLFRGIIQNLLQKSLLKPIPALMATSIIFGAAHLNNGPTPDWRYFLLATIAGLFYGNAYNRTGTLLAPAIVHTLVDTVWRSFFR
jgi:membrane protease YdiL (CAAX protease family)